MIKKIIFRERKVGKERDQERILVKEYWNYWFFWSQPFCKSEIVSKLKARKMKENKKLVFT